MPGLTGRAKESGKVTLTRTTRALFLPTLLPMEAARATWTDSRLDDLNDRVKGMDARMDAGFARLDDRIDRLNHTLVQTMVALISVIGVLLSILIGIIATHL